MTKKRLYLITIILLVSFIVFLISSEDKGQQMESKDVETVTITKTDQTILYSKIETGSVLNWKAYHLGGVNPRHGTVNYKEVSLLVNKGKVTNLSVIIDMTTLIVENLSENENKELSEHLKSNDFFNIESHPTSKFEMTKIEVIQGKYNSRVSGNLEILGVSKNITFKATIKVSDKQVSIKSENFTIDRSDWGMTYNAEGTAGVPLDYLISDKIGFHVSIVCKQDHDHSKAKPEAINDISQLIDSLYTVDQNIQLAHNKAIQSNDNEKAKELALQQKATFKRHIPILKKIYKQIGYPTIEVVGKESSNMYFTLVQHSDSDVKFQSTMLKAMKEEVKKGNINIQNYAFLTDRVGLALKNKQVYGTQVNYNTQLGQAFPKPLIDSINVNKRREDIGLEPIEEYLNKSSKWHFKMNKAHYDALGIKEPKLYDIN